MEYLVSKDEFTISTDKKKLDVDFVHDFLSQSYWTPGISLEKVKKGIEGALCFGMYHNKQQALPTGGQIGFARIISDQASFAYLADVFIDEEYRGKGLGKWMVEAILAHPGLQECRRIMLATKDAHSLYEKCGFSLLPNPERWMAYTPAANKIK